MVKSMISHSTLPESLWEEVIKTTTYILNRLSTKTAAKIPYELWTGRKPSLKYLHIFGDVHLRVGLIDQMKRNWTQNSELPLHWLL